MQQILMRCAVILAAVLSVPALAHADKPSGPLTKVDWANRDYGRAMKLRNGRHEMRRYPHRSSDLAKRCRHTTQSARLIKVHHANVSGDSAPEAIVELSTYADFCNGRSRSHRVLIGFEWRNGKAHEIGRFSPSGVRDVRVRKRRIYVTRKEARKAGWFECKDQWRYRKGKFELIGSSRCNRTRTR